MIFKKIFHNLTSILAARILFQIFNALSQIIIARYLGVEKFGMFSMALALVNAFLVANDIGMVTLMIKEGSKNQEKIKTFLGNTLVVQFVSSIIFYAVTLIVGFSLGYEMQVMLLVIILGLAYMIYEFRKPLRAVLRILLKLKVVAVIETLCGAFILIFIYILSQTELDKSIGLFAVAIIELIGYSILTASFFLYSSKFSRPKFDGLRNIKNQLKISWRYSFYNILYIIYLQASIIMVGALAGPEQAGLYSAASKLVVMLFIVPQMTFQIALPLLFRYAHHDLEKYKRIHKFIFKYLTAYGFPIAIGMWMLAQPIIELVYNKPGYEPASQALQIFGIFIFFRFLGNVSGQSLTAIDKQNQENIIAGSYFIILLIANFFMINAYGFMGAVYTTVVCEALLRLTYIIFDFKYLKLNIFSYFKKLAPIALACALMAVFIYFTKGSLNVIIVVVLSALFYGFLLWLFRFFDAYDKTLFSQLINKKKD